MSDTWLTLQLARDAWDSGRLRESWQLMDQVEVDFEYVERTRRDRILRGRWRAPHGWAALRMAWQTRLTVEWLSRLEWRPRAEPIVLAGTHLIGVDFGASDGMSIRVHAYVNFQQPGYNAVFTLSDEAL